MKKNKKFFFVFHVTEANYAYLLINHSGPNTHSTLQKGLPCVGVCYVAQSGGHTEACEFNRTGSDRYTQQGSWYQLIGHGTSSFYGDAINGKGMQDTGKN
jgi:hypothetical protein